MYGAVALAPDEFRELGRQAAAAAAFGSNILQWTEAGYFDQQETTKPLLHLWSLGVEEQFYIAWPVILAFASGRAARGRARRFAAVIAGLALLSFAISILLVHSSQSGAFYLPVPRFWELLLGGLLAYANTSAAAAAPSPPSAAPASGGLAEGRAGLGLAAILAGFMVIAADRSFPGWWALIPTVGTVLVISAPAALINRTLLSFKPLVFIGLISYPLYLWHWVLLTFIRIHNLGQEPPRSWRLAAIAASVLLAWITYRAIETPIRFSGRRNAIPRALVASMAVCCVAGLVVYATDGFAFRFPPEIRSLAAFQYERERDIHERSYRSGECWLSATETFADLSPRCVDANDRPEANDRAAPLVALWGDSHAASLYPGLHALQSREAFRIAQYTASSCPPILDLYTNARPNCEAFNTAVAHRLGELKPDVVILEAHWALYNGTNGQPDVDAAALHRTIGALQGLEISRIIVMGSLPTWKIVQPRVAFELWRSGHTLQDRTTQYLDEEPFAADRVARAAVVGTGATFISPLDLLCSGRGCLISTAPHTATPLAWDNDHLSIAGSTFLADRAFKSILEPHGPAT